MQNLSLFDLNGDIGRGAIENTPFADTQALLDHMDYLGIERCLVSHVRGRELGATIGNRMLVEEIAANNSARDRLIPAFTISPPMLYESGAMAFLREHVANGNVRALATFPETCHHPLSHLEPLLAELACYRPVLLWNTRQSPNGELDYRDLVTLAAALPEIAFICGKKMWGGFGSVLDAMRRCPNIHVDSSWLHTRRTIEMLVHEFGADRVFFGTGCKTHYGAAIAALVHADISNADRGRIAHGNLEALLGLDPVATAVSGGREDKPLWDAMRKGLPIDAEILDAHGHIGSTNIGFYQPDAELVTTARNTIRQMDRLGIGRIIVSSFNALFGDALEGNREAEQVLAPFRDRFSGYVVFNPRFSDTLVPGFDSLFASGFFVGFKVLSAYWKVRVDDPVYEPMLRYANDHHLPILYHTWDDRWNSPNMLTATAKSYPNASILLGHSGGGTAGRIEAIELANAYSNVYLEFCGSFTSDYPWDETFEQVGFDRVVFGSDGGGMHDQAWELGHLLSQPVPDEKLIPVLAPTMQRLLGASGFVGGFSVDGREVVSKSREVASKQVE